VDRGKQGGGGFRENKETQGALIRELWEQEEMAVSGGSGNREKGLVSAAKRVQKG
jgi:hypothetical protein